MRKISCLKAAHSSIVVGAFVDSGKLLETCFSKAELERHPAEMVAHRILDAVRQGYGNGEVSSVALS